MKNKNEIYALEADGIGEAPVLLESVHRDQTRDRQVLVRDGETAVAGFFVKQDQERVHKGLDLYRLQNYILKYDYMIIYKIYDGKNSIICRNIGIATRVHQLKAR